MAAFNMCGLVAQDLKTGTMCTIETAVVLRWLHYRQDTMIGTMAMQSILHDAMQTILHESKLCRAPADV